MIRKQNVLYAVIFFCLIKPYSLNQIGFLDLGHNILKVLIVLYMGIHLLTKKKVTAITVVGLIFQFIIITSTLIHKGSIYNAFSTAIPMMGVLFLFELYLKDFKNVITTFQFMCELYTAINFVSIVFIGTNNNELTIYFLGSKNGLVIIFPLFILISLLYSVLFKGKKRRTIVLILTIVISVLLTKSTTMVIELLIFVILYAVKKGKTFRNVLNYWSFMLTYIVSNMVLISFSYSMIIVSFFNRYLGKGGNSLKIRVFFWNRALELFRENWILGIGKWTEAQWNLLFSGFNYKVQLHNNIIEFLTIGGIALIIVYLLMLIMVGKKITSDNSQLNYIVSIICALALISVLTSSIYSSEFFMVFLVAYHIDKIKKSR